MDWLTSLRALLDQGGAAEALPLLSPPPDPNLAENARAHRLELFDSLRARENKLSADTRAANRTMPTILPPEPVPAIPRVGRDTLDWRRLQQWNQPSLHPNIELIQPPIDA
jgi:hypothetical protein